MTIKEYWSQITMVKLNQQPPIFRHIYRNKMQILIPTQGTRSNDSKKYDVRSLFWYYYINFR